MRPLGYLYKKVALRPEWLNAASVDDVYSLSACISTDFADYINFWKHNGYWLFDSPETMKAVAEENGLSLEGLKLFYYEGYEQEFDDGEKRWVDDGPESTFETNIIQSPQIHLEGYDVTCFTVHTSPECSPLSCNSLAATLPTNVHCLFSTFEEAVQAVESGAFERSEPGPYRVIAVYSVNET